MIDHLNVYGKSLPYRNLSVDGFHHSTGDAAVLTQAGSLQSAVYDNIPLFPSP